MTAQVTSAEAGLLHLARAAVGDASPLELGRLAVLATPAPGKLGPTARRLLADTLSRGLVVSLARGGGWRQERGGRLWERAPAPPLRFTGNLVRLLAWMLETPLADAQVKPLALSTPLTPAEEAVAVLLAVRLLGTGCQHALFRQAPLRAAPLFALAWAGELGRVAPLSPVPALDVAVHGVFVGGLADVLAAAWVREERLKPSVERPGVLKAVGEAQAAVLEPFLAAVNAAGRRELAGFLIDAAREVLAVPDAAQALGAALDAEAPLRERTEARRAAGAFLRAVGTLGAWHQEHLATRFIDDGYEAAQALARAWDCLGAAGFREAERVMAAFDALPG